MEAISRVANPVREKPAAARRYLLREPAPRMKKPLYWRQETGREKNQVHMIPHEPLDLASSGANSAHGLLSYEKP